MPNKFSFACLHLKTPCCFSKSLTLDFFYIKAKKSQGWHLTKHTCNSLVNEEITGRAIHRTFSRVIAYLAP